MKKYLFVLVLAAFIFGCTRAPDKTLVLLKINNFELTKDEFDRLYKASAFAKLNTPESKREFMNMLITRMLILQDAQAKNMDKEQSFLEMLQRFWEQSLLKIALDKKSQGVSGSIIVSDKEIENAYSELVKQSKTDKEYKQVYDQLKWELTKKKEAQAFNKWVEELHIKANIAINYDLLKNK